MIKTSTERPSSGHQGRPASGSSHHGGLTRSVLTALLCGAMAPAWSAGKEDARSAGLFGVFLVSKEYGTVRGTFLTSVRGRDITRLNYLFGEGVDPRLSPVDNRVLFTSTRGGTPGLWTMDRKGEQQRRVCDGDQGDWFPDGRRILFRRQGQIMERSLDTGQETVLSPAGWKSCSSPACSPDGRKILFVTHQDGKDTLFRTTLEKPEPKRLVEGEIFGVPRWARRGERIVYQSGSHLWMIDADGSNCRQLTTAGGIQRRPAWSPDGSAVAYCEGPGPKGPWQMAAVRVDGTKKLSIPLGDVRSVLCSDWGVENPGQKPQPKGMVVRPQPRVRLWEIDPSVAVARADWAAFCRERKGWIAVPPDNAPHQPPRGALVVENPSALLVLLAGRTGVVLIPKAAMPSAIEFTLLDLQGKDAGPVESVRVLAYGPEGATLESVSHLSGVPVKAAWAMEGSRALVQVTPLDNASKLRAAVPVECVVVPDRFGNDIVVDPRSLGQGRALLPWAPLVTGFLGSGSEVLVLICPGQAQTAEFRKGEGLSFAGADVAFQQAPCAPG